MKQTLNKIQDAFEKVLIKKYGEEKAEEVLNLYKNTVLDFFVDAFMATMKRECECEKQRRKAGENSTDKLKDKLVEDFTDIDIPETHSTPKLPVQPSITMYQPTDLGVVIDPSCEIKLDSVKMTIPVLEEDDEDDSLLNSANEPPVLIYGTPSLDDDFFEDKE